MLPNLLCIGAAKCGTTSLHEYLDLHPQIAMAPGKELNFFTDPAWNWRRGLEWYSEQFPGGTPVRGESSHTYTNHPFAQGVPERIRDTLGQVRLLYVVADPVERLISDWIGEHANGNEKRTFAELVDSSDLEGSGYVMRGRYAHQLSRFLEVFERSDLMVVSRDELAAHPQRTMSAVYDFAGVDPTFRRPALSEVHNPSGPKRRDRTLAGPLRRIPGARRIERRGYATGGLGGRIMRAPFSRRIDRPAPTPEQHERLRSCFLADAERLRELTGLELADWSV
jgi:hypothetical protein